MVPANRAHLGFTEQDLQTIEELGQWTGQTESHDPLHHHSQLEDNTQRQEYTL